MADTDGFTLSFCYLCQFRDVSPDFCLIITVVIQKKVTLSGFNAQLLCCSTSHRLGGRPTIQKIEIPSSYLLHEDAHPLIILHKTGAHVIIHPSYKRECFQIFLNPSMKFPFVHAHQQGTLPRVFPRKPIWLHGHVEYNLLSFFEGLLGQCPRIVGQGEKREGDGGLQVYQFPRPFLARTHVIDDDGYARSTPLLGYFGGIEDDVMGQEIANPHIYSPRFGGLLDEPKANIPVQLGQILFHFPLDLRKGDPFWKLNLDGGGSPRKFFPHSRKGLAGKDVLFRKTEFEETTLDGLIEEIYLLVELILDTVRRSVKVKENEAQY